jgi:hypothetical protein
LFSSGIPRKLYLPNFLISVGVKILIIVRCLSHFMYKLNQKNAWLVFDLVHVNVYLKFVKYNFQEKLWMGLHFYMCDWATIKNVDQSISFGAVLNWSEMLYHISFMKRSCRCKEQRLTLESLHLILWKEVSLAFIIFCNVNQKYTWFNKTFANLGYPVLKPPKSRN